MAGLGPFESGKLVVPPRRLAAGEVLRLRARARACPDRGVETTALPEGLLPPRLVLVLASHIGCFGFGKRAW